MDVAINGLRLAGKRFGVGRYIEYLLKCWKASSHPFDRIVVYAPRPLDDEIDLPERAELRVVPARHSYAYWEQVTLARLRREHDLLFCPSYVAPLFGGGKTVVTHLGSYEALPSAFPLVARWKTRGLYQLSAHRADRLITVSESSKRDIVRFYGVPAHRVTVIPLGVDARFQPIENAELLAATRRMYFNANRPYILFVGKLSKRRHIPELVAAFARLKRTRNIPHGLLLIGEDSVGQNVRRLAELHGVESSVVHREFAAHDELPAIYNAADLFIYPSAYEGFGIPVLEAMACGVPTIALRNSSFLEFADGVAYLAPEGSEGALCSAMERVLWSDELRAHMRVAGPKRASDYGWPTIARQTMDVLCGVGRQELPELDDPHARERRVSQLATASPRRPGQERLV